MGKYSWVVKIKSFQNTEFCINIYLCISYSSLIKKISVFLTIPSTMENTHFLHATQNTVQPLNHIISTAATKKAHEFLYSMPTVLARYSYYSDSYLSIADDVIMTGKFICFFLNLLNLVSKYM